MEKIYTLDITEEMTRYNELVNEHRHQDTYLEKERIINNIIEKMEELDGQDYGSDKAWLQESIIESIRKYEKEYSWTVEIEESGEE